MQPLLQVCNVPNILQITPFGGVYVFQVTLSPFLLRGEKKEPP